MSARDSLNPRVSAVSLAFGFGCGHRWHVDLELLSCLRLCASLLVLVSAAGTARRQQTRLCTVFQRLTIVTGESDVPSVFLYMASLLRQGE